MRRIVPELEQPPPCSVITWTAQYVPGGTVYQYAAVRVLHHGWYTTSTKWPAPLSWEELQRHIGRSPCLMANDWAPIRALVRGGHALMRGEGQ